MLCKSSATQQFLLVPKNWYQGWMNTNHRVLQKIYVIWYSFCILGKSFPRRFEVKELPLPWSCSSYDENYLFLIWSHEEWLSLKKSFWKIYHHSKCFSQYYRSFSFFQVVSIFKKLYAWYKSFFTEELKIP